MAQAQAKREEVKGSHVYSIGKNTYTIYMRSAYLKGNQDAHTSLTDLPSLTEHSLTEVELTKLQDLPWMGPAGSIRGHASCISREHH